MTLYRLLSSVLFAGTALAQSSNPFIGTWVYSADKSPQPVLTYAVKDLGADRYALTGSTGETTEIEADGNLIKSPSGYSVSFRKIDAHTWHMDRMDKEGHSKMTRTYTVSPDDTQLTLTDIYTGDKGESRTVAQYHRTATGKSIFGQWKSFSVKTTEDSKPQTLAIELYGQDGLSLIDSANKYRTDMLFDGKAYLDQGPNGPLGSTTSGKRLNSRLLQLESRTKGKLDDTDEYRISDDGTTLTIVTREAKSSSVFTSVFEKNSPR